jgi:2-oxo-4-hydroxy-4-carboxy-5-ureidoimidazoline decarboxylase
VTLEEFNALSADEARARIRPALDVPRWVDAVATGRPYAHRDALLEAARTAAEPLSDDEVDRALSHHPRIGDRAEGSSAEASLSRREQAAVDPDDAALQQALREGNLAYEERFGRVFLIRAAGRTPQQILDALRTRLGHDEATERGVVAEQLRQIALLRLDGMVAP